MVGCVDLLRVAESAWLSAAQHEQSASWVHFPIFGWLGRPLGQGANPDTLANVIAVLALVKILCSMTWFVIVGLQPSMGVAWHRFLAFITIYARKHDDGTSALGPLEPMIVDGKPLTVDLLDELEESDAEPNFGVSRIEQFHWKALSGLFLPALNAAAARIYARPGTPASRFHPSFSPWLCVTTTRRGPLHCRCPAARGGT